MNTQQNTEATSKYESVLIIFVLYLFKQILISLNGVIQFNFIRTYYVHLFNINNFNNYNHNKR